MAQLGKQLAQTSNTLKSQKPGPPHPPNLSTPFSLHLIVSPPPPCAQPSNLTPTSLDKPRVLLFPLAFPSSQASAPASCWPELPGGSRWEGGVPVPAASSTPPSAHISGSPGVVSGPAALVSPQRLLEIQIPGPSPVLTDQNSRNRAGNEFPQALQEVLKFPGFENRSQCKPPPRSSRPGSPIPQHEPPHRGPSGAGAGS